MTDSTGYYIEDLTEGMTCSLDKMIGEAEVVAFAGLTGDSNPVHLDEQYAAGTMFRSRIAHGMLTASLISTILGTMLPGPGSIYLSQTIRFRAPVPLGSMVTATVTIIAINRKRRRVTLDCECTLDGKVVLDGQAEAMVPARPQG